MPAQQHTYRVLIMGAAGRDFHNFNMVYRDDPTSSVVAFTATQIPQIAGRRYPPHSQARTTPKAFRLSSSRNWSRFAERKGSIKSFLPTVMSATRASCTRLPSH